MADFYEYAEAIERLLHRADTTQDERTSTGGLILAIASLLELARTQHEQIVDLNSRIEYGYTHREGK